MHGRAPSAAPSSQAAGGPDEEAIHRAVAAFQAGERREESFRFLFDTYHRRIRRFFARRCSSADECLDLTQETFLRAFKGLESFRGDAPFGAWLYRIAWNTYGELVARPRARAPARQIDVDLDSERLRGAATGDRPLAGATPLTAKPEGYDSVLDRERRAILRRAIERLPEQRRKCIVLWAYHELTYEQIAVAMRLALGTVKAHLAQARQQLEELTENRGPQG